VPAASDVSRSSIRAASTSSWVCSKNGRVCQKRAGVGPPEVSVGSKTRWNQRCASANRWFADSRVAMSSGAWKKSSQLYCW